MGEEPKGKEAERGAQLAAFLDHPSSQVKNAALGAVSTLKYRSAAEKVRALISGEDLVLAVNASATAAALQDAAAVEAILALARRVLETAPDSAEPVISAIADLKAPGAAELLRGWLRHPHAHVRISAARGLRKLDPAAQVQVSTVEAAAPPAPPGRPPAAPEGAALTFKTAKGEIRVVLDTRSTPLTSDNLFALARKAYFDGVNFHRVEPDFVVQGGDPRGDGEGGPGYSIRCEVSDRRYVRGTVGMALSGKDTGGSQFFFVTSEQPHLEGRYTAFGEVEGAGMEVVDRLMEGDRIESVNRTP
jgi:cyclophilin family peptidyl-prolyl cis-trans isomerase